jgi:hypothetical protein
MTWRALVRRGAAIALAGAVLAAACTSDDDDADRSGGSDSSDASGGDSPGPSGPARSEMQRPADPTTVVPGEGATGLALAATGALFASAPLVVVAPEDDPAEQARAASEAVDLGMPLLLAPAPADPAAEDASTTTMTAATAADLTSVAVADELDRLGAATVLAFGTPAVEWTEGLDDGPDVVAATDDGTSPTSTDPGTSTSTDAEGTDTDLPAVEPGDPLEGLLVLVGSDPASVAATATARSSGARVLRLANADPRADTAAIDLLTEQPPPDDVLAVGSRFGSPARLRRRLDVASTGYQLPGGGQVLFPGRRMIALYGHPGTPSLGVLGEQPLAAAVTRVQGLADQYDRLVDRPVVPAFEIIATVASGSAGPDGNYANEGDVDELRPWIEAAADAGVYVVLDIQPGRTDFLTQAQRYAELLTEPNVGLALDPEWRLGPNQRHMEQIGSVSATEINRVAEWLARLTRQNQLPQKLLLLHQFRPQMITNRIHIDTSHDELAVLIHADGFGTHGQKFSTWNRMLADPPPDVWWGWKNFIDEDSPMLTPAETLAIEPGVLFVSYQ